jgi:hypothetical protein
MCSFEHPLLSFRYQLFADVISIAQQEEKYNYPHKVPTACRKNNYTTLYPAQKRNPLAVLGGCEAIAISSAL